MKVGHLTFSPLHQNLDASTNSDKLFGFLGATVLIFSVEYIYRIFEQPALTIDERLFASIIGLVHVIAAVMIGLKLYPYVTLCVHVSLLVANFVFYYYQYANHWFLHVWFVGGAILFLRSNPAKQLQLIGLYQFMFLTMLFWTGLQKLLHGAWFQAEFIYASIAGGDPRFEVLPYLVGDSHLIDELKEMAQRTGSGPYRSDKLSLTLLSNSVWLLEVLLPVAMLVQRWRAFVLPCIVVFFVLMQVPLRLG